MDPVPKMVIQTPAAVRKGQLEVATAEEIDALISQLIIAKTGLLGAQSAIGAQGAMDAAREVEAERAERADDLVAWCDLVSRDGRRCVRVAHRPEGICLDDQGRVLHYGDPAERGLASCGHPADEDGECDCSSWPERAPLAAWAAKPEPDGDGWPPPCPSCGQRDEHSSTCARAAQLATLGAQVRELSRPATASPAGRHEVPRAAELMPRDESLPWAGTADAMCGWPGPGGDSCGLVIAHGATVDHASLIGGSSMRRWPALRSVSVS